MKSIKKAELLKNTITTLYSKEGRSISYISKLLEINRHTISCKVKEWDLPKPAPQRHPKPSTQKFINRYKELIISRLNHGASKKEICSEIGCAPEELELVFVYNQEAREANAKYLKRAFQKSNNCND